MESVLVVMGSAKIVSSIIASDTRRRKRRLRKEEVTGERRGRPKGWKEAPTHRIINIFGELRTRNKQRAVNLSTSGAAEVSWIRFG